MSGGFKTGPFVLVKTGVPLSRLSGMGPKWRTVARQATA